MPPTECPIAIMLERHRERLAMITQSISRRLPPALGARFDADDVLQVTYLRASQAGYSNFVESRLSEFAWLYRKMRDSLHDLRRSAQAEQRDVGREAPPPDLSSYLWQPVDEGTGPATAAQREERDRAMQRVLENLLAEEREIVELRKDGMEYREIGELLGLTANAACQRYYRAIQKFNRLMRERFPTWSDVP